MKSLTLGKRCANPLITRSSARSTGPKREVRTQIAASVIELLANEGYALLDWSDGED